MRGIAAGMLRFLARLGIFRWVTGYRYVLAPTQIFMVGTLVESTRDGASSASEKP